MKKLTEILSSYFGHMGFYFLLAELPFALIALVTKSATFNLVLVWSALLFAAMLALCDLVFLVKAIRSYAVKLSIHAVLAVVCFAVAFVAVSGVIESGKSALWSIFLFAIFMILVSGIRGVLHMVLSKKENDTKTYDYLYTPKA